MFYIDNFVYIMASTSLKSMDEQHIIGNCCYLFIQLSLHSKIINQIKCLKGEKINIESYLLYFYYILIKVSFY